MALSFCKSQSPAKVYLIVGREAVKVRHKNKDFFLYVISDIKYNKLPFYQSTHSTAGHGRIYLVCPLLLQEARVGLEVGRLPPRGLHNRMSQSCRDHEGPVWRFVH